MAAKRRWFTISLRTLFVAITLLSVIFAWFLHHRRQMLAERERLKKVFAGHGLRLRFRDSALGWALPDIAPELPDRWRTLRAISAPVVDSLEVPSGDRPLPEEFPAVARRARRLAFYSYPLEGELWRQCLSQRTEEVVYHRGHDASEDLAWLEDSPYVQSLTTNSKVTTQGIDALLGLDHLRHATFKTTLANLREARGPLKSANLTSLSINIKAATFSPATARDYAWLSEQPRLTYLDLYDTIDLGLLNRFVDRCPAIEHVGLYWFPYTPRDPETFQAAFAALERLPNLQSITVSHVYFDAAIAQKLGRCTNLTSITFNGSGGNVSPEELRPLLKLTKLKQLSLNDCGLTDAHVPVLTEFTFLDHLSLLGNQITAGKLYTPRAREKG